jgi:hypothetical protein
MLETNKKSIGPKNIRNGKPDRKRKGISKIARDPRAYI